MSCAAVQAIELKGLTGQLSQVLSQFSQWVRIEFDFVVEDRPLQKELQAIVDRLENLGLLNAQLLQEQADVC
jgi:histidine ammonia-lyase